MVLRMEMRWAERRGFDVELLEASPGEEAGIKSATFMVKGENAYGLYGSEKGVHRLVRLSPFDAAHRRQTSFAGVEVSPGGRGHRRGRDRRRRPADRHVPRQRRRRPARQQDRLGRADHPQADRDRRAVPERALAIVQQGGGDDDAALQAARARGAQAARGDRAGEAARPRTSTSALRSAPTCCTRTRWSRTTAPTSRWATPTRVLDGDLDGFARAYLLKAAKCDPTARAAESARAAAEQPTAPYLEAVTAYGFRGSTALPRPGPQGRRGRRPGAAHRARRPRAAARRPPGHRGDRRRAVADAVRARRAARRGRLRRAAHLVSHQRRHPGQPRVVPGAGAARRARGAPAQLARQPDRRPGAERRAGPASWRPSTTTSSGMAHGVTPEALARRARARSRTRRPRSSSRPPTTGWRPTSRACAEVAHARRRGADRRLRLGLALRLSPARCPRSPARARGRRDARLDPQDRRQPHPVGDAARRRHGAGRHRGGGPRRAPGPLDQPELAADGVAGRRPPPARGARRGAARPHDSMRPSGRETRSTRSPAAPSSASRSSAAQGSPAGIRCGS